MYVKNSYGLILMGLLIRYLVNINDKYIVRFVLEEIDKLILEFKDANFEVSFAGSYNLRNIANELRTMDPNESIGIHLYNQILAEINPLEKIVYAEAHTKKIYVIPTRRFNSEYLLNTPEMLFKENAFTKISDLGQYDIRSACRCLSFGEATASAFHILRATEEVLKQYYLHHIKRNRLKTPMWGPMTTELRNKSRNKPPTVLLNSLDLVRTSYRNPTQHPDAIYDIESAQDLFGVCLDVLGKMLSEL